MKLLGLKPTTFTTSTNLSKKYQQCDFLSKISLEMLNWKELIEKPLTRDWKDFK